ncbi:tryptophan dimethylallyltransferase family protein [Catenulispora rubra]|uniref:tryptophan dimethylallyltransferase family protein n=1 Tax=Catenulispora rubra TaxID=280293 RepID=UPI001892457C|nr:tryptophan dimethylallyltransferase family protein [Catenulispora rubra]
MTATEICEGQVRRLCSALGLGAQADLAASTFAEMTRPWNRHSPAALPPSDVSADGSPVEYAVELNDGKPTLQIAVEPMTLESHASTRTYAARGMMARLARAGWASPTRWSAVADLFLLADTDTDAPEPQAHAAMYGAEIDSSGLRQCKVWFYAGIAGAEHAPTLVRQALERLHMPAAWTAIERHVDGDFVSCRPILVSLDLTDHATARTKVYFRHYDAGFEYLARLMAGHGLDPADTTALCRVAGPDDAALARQPPVTCLSFHSSGTRPPVATLYVPLWLAADDATVRQRVHNLLSGLDIPPARYDACLAAVARRPLADARGLHNYLGLQRGADGRHRIKCYWSPELRQTDPPARYLDAQPVADPTCASL